MHKPVSSTYLVDVVFELELISDISDFDKLLVHVYVVFQPMKTLLLVMMTWTSENYRQKAPKVRADVAAAVKTATL